MLGRCSCYVRLAVVLGSAVVGCDGGVQSKASNGKGVGYFPDAAIDTASGDTSESPDTGEDAGVGGAAGQGSVDGAAGWDASGGDVDVDSSGGSGGFGGGVDAGKVDAGAPDGSVGCVEAVQGKAGAAESYFVQPKVAACGVDQVVLGDEPPAANAFSVVMWRLGASADDTLLTWDVSKRTGFMPSELGSLGLWQRGPADEVDGPAVQVRGREVGVWLNSESWSHVGEIIPTVIHYDFTEAQNIRPWSKAQSELSYAFDMQVPSAEVSGTGAVYVTPVFAFRNVVSGKSFWWVTQVFDLRAANAESVIYDSCSTCTGLPIVMGTLTGGSKFVRLGEGSGTFTSTPWKGYRSFDVRVTRNGFARALSALVAKVGASAGHSTSVDDYQLVHFNFNPEVYAPAGKGKGTLGLSVRKLELARYVGRTVSKLKIRAANGGTDKGMLQVFFKTLGDTGYSEQKSVKTEFPGGGGWSDLAVEMSSNPDWKGIISGIRIDPLSSNQSFGIDDICLADSAGTCVLHWDFNGASQVASPFFGWTLGGIGFTWADGQHWGGAGKDGDPQIAIDVDVDSGR